MTENTKSRGISYVKYAILLAIVVVVGLFFLFRFSPKKTGESEKIEKEALERIEAVKKEPTEPVDLEMADQFVSAKTLLSKKDRRIITTTPKALLEDPSLGVDSEIMVLTEEERVTITTPRELLKDRTIHPDTPLRILKDDWQATETTVTRLLADPSITPDTPIKIIEKDGQVTETTVTRLLTDPSITPDTPIKIIEKEEKVIVTTLGELQKMVPSPESPIKIVVEKPGETVTLAELFPDQPDVNEDDTFYIHSVTRGDKQGIWGIIQHGLMDQFLKGIPVAGVAIPEEDILTLTIPEQADERLDDGYSSYLGRVLAQKTRESHVYNYSNGRMGRNPDYIRPGQEVVISRFSKSELVDIYKHFHKNR
jgi:hypothetical protein